MVVVWFWGGGGEAGMHHHVSYALPWPVDLASVEPQNIKLKALASAHGRSFARLHLLPPRTYHVGSGEMLQVFVKWDVHGLHLFVHQSVNLQRRAGGTWAGINARE